MTFLAFWQIYPRRVAKKAAERSYLKALSEGAKPEDIISGVKRYIAHIQEKEIQLQFVKHPATWLNGWCFEDEYTLNLPVEEEQKSNVTYIQDLMRRCAG